MQLFHFPENIANGIQRNNIGFSYPKQNWPLLSQGPPQKMDQSVNFLNSYL